jgi:hypothetical protein
MRPTTNRTHKKRARFLEALENGATVTMACRFARFPRRTAYDQRAADKAFAAQWDDAIEVGTEALEDEARRRAVEGTLKPVYYQGVQIGEVREYSDALLMLLLKANRPGKYREPRSLNVAEKTDSELLQIVRNLRSL